MKFSWTMKVNYLILIFIVLLIGFFSCKSGKPLSTSVEQVLQDSISSADTSIFVQDSIIVPAIADSNMALQTDTSSLMDTLTGSLAHDTVQYTERSLIMDTVPEIASGILFKVQVGAFQEPGPSGLFKELDNVKLETISGIVRYIVGEFEEVDKAIEFKNKLIDDGYDGAWVVAYHNGKRIPYEIAKDLLKLSSQKD